MKTKRFLLVPLSIVLVFAFAACGDGPDDPDPTTAATPTAEGAGTPIVLEGATETASGLRYVDDVVGTGEQPTEDSFVTVHYTGWLASNGEKFDSSVDRGQPAVFPVLGVIPGFTEALLGMQVGGKRTAYLPAAIAYAEQGRAPSIPPNADLVFEIELLEVSDQP